MKLTNKLLATAAVVAFAIPLAANAHEEKAATTSTTVTTQTYVEPQKIDGVNEINFSAFDINGDGLYAKSEVGEKLFYTFDLDGNEVIDNEEWDERSVYTITPMEKETFTFVDYNSDGYTELSTYNYDRFYEESALILFDQNKDGLSASEFIDANYKELDIDHSGMIELDEWKSAYTEMTKPKNAQQERYN